MFRKEHLFAAMVLLIWLTLAVHTVFSTSVTHDEIWHLPAGLRGWNGDFTPDRVNPPLSRLWSAFPVRLCGMTASAATNADDLGNQFVAEHDDFLRWYYLGRLFNLLWPCAVAVLLYIWSCQAIGLIAGRITLLCFLCDSNVFGHGALVTPDSAAMFGFLLTSYCLTRWLNQPTWRAAVFLGLALGLLQAAKFHGLVFYPVVIACGAVVIYRQNQGRLSVAGQVGLALLLSLAVLAVCFGGQRVGEPVGDFVFVSRRMQNLQSTLQILKSFPVPFPADYMLGIDRQLLTMESPHPVFLDGIWQLHGFHDYFAKALAYKLSHGFQLLILCGVVAAWRNRGRGQPWRGLAVWAPVALLFITASFSDLQLGLRYVLPIVPACALLAGRSLELLPSFSPAAQRFLQAVILIALLSSWRFHPHHLSYFNEFAGGPIGGRSHLLDSNLDWGQDLLRARDFIAAHRDENPRFVYFGTVDPRRVGIQAELPPSRSPEPGLHLVSVNFVMGRPHMVRLPDGTHRAVDVHEFSYFRVFEPVARCGYSIDVYRITEEDIRRVSDPANRSAFR